MSLQFVIGNAGSGKSTYLYQYVIAEAQKHPKENYLVVVPEQFTMHTQKQLVAMHPSHSIMNIDILSFERMAYRVFDELGTDTLEVLEEAGKNMLLRKIAQENADELVSLKRNIKKQGYIGEIKSLISELMQYNISPEKCKEIADCPQMTKEFQAKAADVLLLYEQYRNKLSGKYITAEEVLQKLMDIVGESAILKNATIVFDGFTGFTPIQNELFRKLLRMAKKIMVTVTGDEATTWFEEPKEQELFAMSKKTVRHLTKTAREEKVFIEPPVILTDTKTGRFLPGGYLEHLEKNLFRPHAKEYKAVDKAGDEICLLSFADPRQEMTYVACEIERQVRQENMHYRDFAVVCADMETYRHMVPGIFEKLHIPYFTDAKREIIFHPFVECMNSLFAVIDENFSYHSVMRLLRTQMTDITTEEADLFENYILAAHIRGYAKYKNRFSFIPNGYSAEQMTQLEAIREKLAKPVEGFYEKFPKKRGTAEEISTMLYAWIVSYGMEEKLCRRAEALEEAHEEVKAKEYRQIYASVMQLLDKLVAILGEEEMSLREYGEILSAGFEALKIGVIPPEADSVLIGDMQRSRLSDIKALYLVGARDGAIPKATGNGGIFSQMERRRLKEASFELAPTDREKSFMERFYLYFVMTKPSQKLVISYPRTDNVGNAAARSYLFGVMKKMFPDVCLQMIEELSPAHRFMTSETAWEYFVDALGNYVQTGECSEEFTALLSLFLKEDKEKTENYLRAAYYKHEDEQLSEEAIEMLFGNTLTESVSRMEQYASCAYAFFLKYGLHLYPRAEHGFETVDIGNLYHMALDDYAKRLQNTEGVNWYTITPEQMRSLLREAITNTYQTMEKTQILDAARETFLLKHTEKTLEQTVWALTEQVRKGSFVPNAFEVDFREIGDLKTLRYELDEMHTMRLRGKIDRIDLCEQEDCVYVKIIDYKSGSRDLDFEQLYNGLQVQLVLYMGAAMEGIQKQYPEKKTEPAAMLYYHIHHPWLGMKYETEEERETALLKMLKMKGAVNRDERIIEAMDHGLQGDSIVIPMGYKKDGQIMPRYAALSTEEFRVMTEYTVMLMKECGRRILRGEIPCKPYKHGEKESCTYCEYHGICGFDEKLEGYAYRRLEQVESVQDALEKMKIEIAKNNGRGRNE